MKKNIIILFLFIAPAGIFADSMKLVSIGMRFGTVSPSVGDKNTLSFGLSGNMISENLPVILCPYVDYWATEYHENKTKDWRRSLFAAGISALLPFNLNNSKAVPFIGGGFGLNLNSWIVSVNSLSPGPREYEIDLTLNAIAGLELPLGAKMSGFVEIKYVLAGVIDYYGVWGGLKVYLAQQ